MYKNKNYLRDMDRKIRAKEPATLPETIQGCDNGAGKQLVQDLVHQGDLRVLRDARLVAQVLQLPGSE